MPRAQWEFYAAELPADKLKDAILPGAMAHPEAWRGADFTFLRDIKQLRFGSVLDFGCGLGRNIVPLSRVFEHVDGFDLPAMVERFRQVDPEGFAAARCVYSDWPVAKRQRYDLIVSELVFQHIYEAELRPYLAGLAEMAPYVWLLVRSWNDDSHKNNFKIIKSTGLFTAEYVRANPDRVLGPEPAVTEQAITEALDKLERDDSDFHCVMLLRSNRFSGGQHTVVSPGLSASQPIGETELVMLENLAHAAPPPEEKTALYDEGILRDNIFFANMVFDQTIGGRAESGRPGIGRLLSLVKRAQQRLMGWYVDPALKNQREFNAYIAQATREMIHYLDDTRKREDEAGESIARELAAIHANLELINRHLCTTSPGFGEELALLRPDDDPDLIP